MSKNQPSKLFLFFLIVFSLFTIPTGIPDAFAAAPTYITTVSNSTEAGTSCTVDVNVTASTDLIVTGMISDVAINTISDEDTQTYTLRASHTTSHFSYIHTTTSPTTNAANTITFTTSSTADIRCFAVTYSGVDTGSPIGNTGSNGGAISPASDTITYSTGTNDSDIVHICGIEWSDTLSFDTGKTIRASISDGGANKFAGALATETTTTAGSNDATCGSMSTGKEWSHAVVEVKGVTGPDLVVDLLDVYESSSTTLDSGTAVCTDIDLEIADDCNGLQTATYTDSLSVSATVSGMTDIAWSSDGTKMFLTSFGDDEVDEYTCTAWDVSTCSHVDGTSFGTQETELRGITWSSDGTKMYLTGSAGDDVNEYSCTAWDVSTCSFNDTLSVSAQEGTPQALAWNSDGTKIFVLGFDGKDVNEYGSCTAWDVSTCSFVDSKSVNSEDTLPAGLFFSEDGKQMYMSGRTDDEVTEYSCTTGFDVSTCSFVSSFSVVSQSTSPQGVAFSSDFTKMYIADDTGFQIDEWALNAPLKIGTTYRFEIEVDNNGGTASSPDDVTLASVVGTGEMFGSITATDITSSGCGTNTDWTDSIVTSTDIQLDAGTTCSIGAGGTQEYWFIVTIGAGANDNTATFDVSDGTNSDVSTTTNFDVITGTTDYTKSLSDNFSITDQQDFSTLLNFADPMSITDSVATSAGRSSSKSDPLSITDNVSTFIVRFDSESDPLSITDSVTTMVTYTNTESDPLSITDSVTSHVTKFPSDPLSITDSITTIEGKLNTESDPLSITDSVATQWTKYDTESDPISITDSVTETVTRMNAESDPLSITDSVTTALTRYDTESDPLSITDSITTITGKVDTESDPLSITDSVTELLTRFDAESDPLSITDSITDTVARLDTESDPLSITDVINATCTGCGTNLDTESDPLSLVDSITSLTTRNIGFVEEVDVGDDDGGGGIVISVDRFDSESDPISFTDSLVTVVSRFFTNSDQLSITDNMTATNSSGVHFINVTESVNVNDQQDTYLFFYEPTGKVIWFKVADPSNSTKGGVYSYMCDSTEIVTGINGTGYVKCTTLYAPTNSTRGGVYSQSCGGSEYVSGIDSNGDLICTALP